MLSAKVKRDIHRIVPFGLIWLFFGVVYILLEKGILGDFNYYPSTGNPYHFIDSLWIALPVTAVAGLVIGTFEVLYLNKQFEESSFYKKIIAKSFIYLIIIISFLIINTTITTLIELETGYSTPQVLGELTAFTNNFAFLSLVIYVAAALLVTLFYNEVSENIGQEVLVNFITGKYHKPIQEERIFMFLDMKSSTTIAEKIGHVKYFEMLSMYYADLSPSVIEHSGEIYQYVGDEIIVSWKLKNGTNQNNCLNCFFSMRKILQQKSETYKERFNQIPTFKAGFHIGRVTTGEIGVIKKDIIFTGDVLNTTARIQSLCNELKVQILISGQLMQVLNNKHEYCFEPMGEYQLRGRDEKVDLYTLSPST